MDDIWGAPKEIPVAVFKDTNPDVYVDRATDCIRRGNYKQAFLELQYSFIMSGYSEHYIKELVAFCEQSLIWMIMRKTL